MTVPAGGVGFDLLAPGHRAFHFEFNYTDNAYEDSRGRRFRSVMRSRTSPEVARAMASQWTAFIREQEQGS